MKLRLRNNSIRLRLTQTEIAQLQETGIVEEVIDFGSAAELQFVYGIEISPMISEIEGRLEKNRITISIPKRQADTWISTDQVGFEKEQPFGGDKTLRILIEKDFACLEPRSGTEYADTFPHPANIKTRKSPH